MAHIKRISERRLDPVIANREKIVAASDLWIFFYLFIFGRFEKKMFLDNNVTLI